MPHLESWSLRWLNIIYVLACTSEMIYLVYSAHGILWSSCFQWLAGNVQSWCIASAWELHWCIKWHETKWVVTTNICVMPHVIELSVKMPFSYTNELTQLSKRPSLFWSLHKMVLFDFSATEQKHRGNCIKLTHFLFIEWLICYREVFCSEWYFVIVGEIFTILH